MSGSYVVTHDVEDQNGTRAIVEQFSAPGCGVVWGVSLMTESDGRVVTTTRDETRAMRVWKMQVDNTLLSGDDADLEADEPGVQAVAMAM